MSRTIDPNNMSDEDRAYLAQRDGLRRLDPVRVENLPPVNTGQANTQLAEINAHGSPQLDPLGDLTSVAMPDPDLAFSEDETDIAHDDPTRTTVGLQESIAVEYPVQVTMEGTPVNMA